MMCHNIARLDGMGYTWAPKSHFLWEKNPNILRNIWKDDFKQSQGYFFVRGKPIFWSASKVRNERCRHKNQMAERVNLGAKASGRLRAAKGSGILYW